MMNAFGGYLELERFAEKKYPHNQCIKMSSARNCLRYLICALELKKIYLPYLLCDAMEDVCKKEGIEIQYYHVNGQFMPLFDEDVLDNERIVIVNYYGVLRDVDINQIVARYKNVIIDSTHAFFRDYDGSVCAIYNCRKYFGVPDGAFLACDKDFSLDVQVGKSGNRMKHLVGRFEYGPDDYYLDFKGAEESFYKEGMMGMSRLTENLLRAIDYEEVMEKRRKNMKYVHYRLSAYNRLKLDGDNEIDFMYPLWVDNAEELRKGLLKSRVFTPLLWPNVIKYGKGMLEYDMAMSIVPIPIDQRYELKDMKKICDFIEEIL